MRTSKLRSLVARTLVITMTSALLPTQTRAEMINTERAIAADRERVLQLLDQPDLAARLEAYGVTSSDAKVRVAALSDAEVAHLAAQIDEAYAGAGGGGGLLAVMLVAVMVVFVLPFVLVGAVILHSVRGGGGSEAQP